MYYLIAGVLIACLIVIEGYCGLWLYEYFKRRSEQRTAAKRAATRPRIYKAVHDSWTIERNRRSLWSIIDK